MVRVRCNLKRNTHATVKACNSEVTLWRPQGLGAWEPGRLSLAPSSTWDWLWNPGGSPDSQQPPKPSALSPLTAPPARQASRGHPGSVRWSSGASWWDSVLPQRPLCLRPSVGSLRGPGGATPLGPTMQGVGLELPGSPGSPQLRCLHPRGSFLTVFVENLPLNSFSATNENFVFF